MMINILTTRGKLNLSFLSSRDAQRFKDLDGNIRLVIQEPLASNNMYTHYEENVLDVACQAAKLEGQVLTYAEMHELICTASGLLNRSEVFNFKTESHHASWEFINDASRAVEQFFNIKK